MSEKDYFPALSTGIWVVTSIAFLVNCMVRWCSSKRATDLWFAIGVAGVICLDISAVANGVFCHIYLFSLLFGVCTGETFPHSHAECGVL